LLERRQADVVRRPVSLFRRLHRVRERLCRSVLRFEEGSGHINPLHRQAGRGAGCGFVGYLEAEEPSPAFKERLPLLRIGAGLSGIFVRYELLAPGLHPLGEVIQLQHHLAQRPLELAFAAVASRA